MYLCIQTANKRAILSVFYYFRSQKLTKTVFWPKGKNINGNNSIKVLQKNSLQDNYVQKNTLYLVKISKPSFF